MTTLLGFSTAVSAQKPVLKGTVVDSKGKPVAGALVNVTETNRLAVTDADGKFAAHLPDTRQRSRATPTLSSA